MHWTAAEKYRGHIGVSGHKCSKTVWDLEGGIGGVTFQLPVRPSEGILVLLPKIGEGFVFALFPLFDPIRSFPHGILDPRLQPLEEEVLNLPVELTGDHHLFSIITFRGNLSSKLAGAPSVPGGK